MSLRLAPVACLTIAVQDVDERFISFQVGVESSQKLIVSVEKLDSGILFDGQPADIRTQEHAVAAFNVIQDAIDRVTARRAYTGSQQSSVNILSGANSTELQNQDAARGVLMDTDIVSASTRFATELVLSDASISIAAQTTRLHKDVVLGLLDNRLPSSS